MVPLPFPPACPTVLLNATQVGQLNNLGGGFPAGVPLGDILYCLETSLGGGVTIGGGIGGGTAGRVLFEGAGPVLADSASLTFNGTTLSTVALNLSGLTASKAVFTDGAKNLTSVGSLGVSQGGTGLLLTVPYAIMAGGTGATTPLQQVSGVGAVGQVLTSNGPAALPTWQASSGGGGSTVPGFDTGTFGITDGFVCYNTAVAMQVAKTDAAAMATSRGAGFGTAVVGTIAVTGTSDNVKFTTAGGMPANGAAVFLALASDDGATGAGKLTATPVIAPNVSAEMGICLDNTNYAALKTCKILIQIKAPVQLV